MNTIIFDLDGTLLPMKNQELFLEAYFHALGIKLEPHGLDMQKLMKAFWESMKAMLENDGSQSNQQAFWDTFCNRFGDEVKDLEVVFEDFYQNEFHTTRKTTSTHPLAKECIKLLKEKGYSVVLATNPVFPWIATHTRIRWAGLEPQDFQLITTYENSSFCKPQMGYYKEILDTIGKEPMECMMVGNDVKEDMCAAQLGMGTYLLNDCLITNETIDHTDFQQGDFDDLYQVILNLPSLSQ